MKVLFISYDGLTDPLGQSQILPYLTKLSNLGHRVTILSAEKDAHYNLGRNTIDKIVELNNIKWVTLKYHQKPKLISTLLDINSLRRATHELHKENGYDLVHCRSYITSLIGLELKRKHGVKFIFDMRGYWADERIDGDIWSMSNPLHAAMYRYFKRKETVFLKSADYTITLTEKAKVHLVEREDIPNQPIPIEVIPCCVDLEHFDFKVVKDEERTRLRSELNISPEDFVLSYLGSVGTWYMLEEMFAFFAQLSKRKENSKFLFISGDSRDEICSKAARHGISEDKIIVRKGSRQEVPSLISLSTASVFFIKPVFSKQASSPTKLGELLGLGIPIIANSGVGDMDKLFQDNPCGLLVEHFTEEDYDRVLEQIDDIVAQDQASIREIAEKHLSLEHGVQKYAAVYDKLAT